MNRHFKDTWYYLKRTAETAKHGIVAELRPIEGRLRALTGRERETESKLELGRLERLRLHLKQRGKETVTGVRKRFKGSGEAR